VPPARVAPGDKVAFKVELNLPSGFKLNPEEPMPYLVETPGKAGILSADVPAEGARVSPPSERFTISASLAKEAADGQTIPLRLSLSAYICREGKGGLCTVRSFIWNVPVTFAAGAPDHIELGAPEAMAANP